MARLFSAGALALFAVSAAPALASGVAWEFITPGPAFTNNDWNFGNKFAARNFRVTHLGYFDSGQDGFLSDHQLALYDDKGVLLRSVTVITENCFFLSTHFCFTPISPVVLNGNYWIHGTSGQDPYSWNSPGFATHPAITYLGNTWAPSGGGGPVYLGFLRNDVGNGFWGPNLAGAVVPEPATWAMLIAGFGLVGSALRRRRRTVAA